ncbi:MAG: PEGA domain-containing protein, partial [Myxococcota bacterium]
EVRIASIPSGAAVDVDGTPVGTTPVTLKLKRRHTHAAVMRKEGYEESVVELKSAWSGEAIGWSLVGAVVFWGPFEWFLDVPLGSLKELSQTSVRSKLEATEEHKHMARVAEQQRQWKLRRRTQARRARWERVCRRSGWNSLSCQYSPYAPARGGR